VIVVCQIVGSTGYPVTHCWSYIPKEILLYEGQIFASDEGIRVFGERFGCKVLRHL
jgi:hypothetical protein